MSGLEDLLHRGGPVMLAIMLLSAVLYSRCFTLLLSLRRLRRTLRRAQPADHGELELLRKDQEQIHEAFRMQRASLAAMIAAAPLLGLLGTVSGMATTFQSLALQDGQKSMEGLAGGISEVLIATESGLAVAIPAMILVYAAHRELHKQLQQINRLEQALHSADQP